MHQGSPDLHLANQRSDPGARTEDQRHTPPPILVLGVCTLWAGAVRLVPLGFVPTYGHHGREVGRPQGGALSSLNRVMGRPPRALGFVPTYGHPYLARVGHP